MIALQDPDFLDDVPADRPAMIVAEGVMMYLSDDIVRSLLNRLTGHSVHSIRRL
jgi:O-methyltransferase involved in polyketide biosynthesis